jgi:hypothetical protein
MLLKINYLRSIFRHIKRLKKNREKNSTNLSLKSYRDSNKDQLLISNSLVVLRNNLRRQKSKIQEIKE